jgi:tRNA pseudouridine13 synthase
MLDQARNDTFDIVRLDQLSYVHGKPDASALIKQQFTDFLVDEELGFPLTGEGEHLYLRVKKTDVSTIDVARRLAAVTDSTIAGIGYCGMKDKRAQCTQWFSIALSRDQESSLAEFENEAIAILETQRNSRKLKIGSHKTNHFNITLREVSGSQTALNEKLSSIEDVGIANYFGSQRFGRQMSNLTQVLQLMRSELNPAVGERPRRFVRNRRHKNGMLYSAARAYLFNQLLSRRLQQENWNSYVPGDVLNLDGTNRYFMVAAAEWDDELQARLECFDIHVSGPLAGVQDPKDKYVCHDEAADIEDGVLREFPLLVDGLRHFQLKAARRPLRFTPGALAWQWLAPRELNLQFTLPRGSYATSFLREVCNTN